MSAVTKLLNQLQADAHASFIKIHNYHWNVKGLQFHSIHKMTEEAYDEMAELFDEVAERTIQLGSKALVKVKDLSSMAKIKEEDKDNFEPKEVIKGMLKDYKYFLETLRELDKAADKEGDTTTSAFAQEEIAKLEKKIWMFEATLG